VNDRVAQTVVKEHLGPLLEPHFHSNSFGYRPGRSAHQAVQQARGQCWKQDWVLDLDIEGFFDKPASWVADESVTETHHREVGVDVCRALAESTDRTSGRAVGIPREGQGGVIASAFVQPVSTLCVRPMDEAVL